MRFGWFLLFSSLVGGCVGDSEDKLIEILDNITDTVEVTETCRLSLKLFSLDSGRWNADAEGNSTRCYNIRSSEAFNKAKCRFKYISPEDSKATQSNWTLVEDLGHGSNATFLVVQANLTSAFPTSSVCFPASCTHDDVFHLLRTVIDDKFTFCKVETGTSPSFNFGMLTAIIILSLFIFMMTGSTMYDIYCKINKSEPVHECLVAFSIHRNGKRVFKTTRSSSEMLCLNGMRFLSMIWVIVLHTFSETAEKKFRKRQGFPKSECCLNSAWHNSWESMTVRSGVLAVDSFLIVGGTLLSYNFMAKRSKVFDEKFNIFRHYLHRYISAGLLGNVGSPEYREHMNSRVSEHCQKYWWSALLYVQNYVNVGEICLSHTWYLSVDMQLYLISPLILLPLWKQPKMGVAFLGLCVSASIVVPFYVAYEKQLMGMPGIFPLEGTLNRYTEYLLDYYYRTHARATPWFIGVLLGYILYRVKCENLRKPEIKKIVQVILWITCSVVMMICVYGGHVVEKRPYNRLEDSLFIALVKPAWSLCIMWIILACALGYGGPVNWILSHSVNQIFITFTYSMYIVHLPIIYVVQYAADTIKLVHFSVFSLVWSSCYIFVLSFGVSVIWVLAFEYPAAILEKYILKR
ncbi:hypothetical protein NQ318_012218 [Aromia moschata]|uniref:Acyltransferase 3 domain-containing protein n=1 Tax=Aromia moschata TaxID=1265417 RepID=A0AAV8YJ92_9CUCU|nr:hypothetical protein NQ318_012218 [Aromia moschata]